MVSRTVLPSRDHPMNLFPVSSSTSMLMSGSMVMLYGTVASQIDVPSACTYSTEYVIVGSHTLYAVWLL